MRNRLFLVVVAVALAIPAVVVSIVTAGVRATPAAAVSSSPAWSKGIPGWNRSSSPAIADVNHDGVNDVVYGHQDGKLRVVSGSSGSPLPGWPQQTGTSIDSSPAVADMDHDGHKEIIVGLGSTWSPNQKGGVMIYNDNGSRHCIFRTRDVGNIWTHSNVNDGNPEPVFSSPAIGDINGDGKSDAVFGSFDMHIHGIDHNCKPILDEYVEDTIWSSPAMYDLNHDGRQEIFIGSDQYAGGYIDWSGGEFRALQWYANAPGHVRELWKRQIQDTLWSSGAIGDIDGDHRLEIVVGAGSFYGRTDGKRVYAWHLDNGSTVRGWPVTTLGSTMPSPALGDLTGDGVPEVVVSSYDGYVRAYRGNGALMWARGLTFNDQHIGGAVASPIIADLDGDRQNDVGAGNDWGYFVLNGRTGVVMSKINTWSSYDTAGAVGYFGGAGWKIIVSGFDTPHHSTTISAYNIPTPGKTPEWPEFRRDPGHHGGAVT